jgi:hypothetical protein
MADENNYSIWLFLKQCHDRGLIYRGIDSMPWCPRCSTGISHHEIATEGYEDITHTSMYVKLPLIERPGESLLIWTTTPWTLPANVAAEVHPDLTYVRVRQGDDVLILSKGTVASALTGAHEVIGELTGKALSVPGHTPACVAYQFGEAVFVGDTLFMPDVGTARCDFPGGDAGALYASIRQILSLPPDTRLFMCHDYPPKGREVAFQTTVAEQRAKNIHVHDGISEADFVAMRTQRDATLEMPVLLLPAVQINIRAGELPPKEANGIAYAKIPLNAL